MFWRINEHIRAPRVRVIGPDGKQIGVLAREEALAKAREAGSDAVEIAPHARPPVVKLVEFAKFKYVQEKKEREARRKEKRGEVLKEVWLTPFIGNNDYQVRLDRIKEFLGEGAKVRIAIRPKTRLFNTRPLYTILERVVDDLQDVARVEQPPKMLGKQLVALFAPERGGKQVKFESEHHEDKIEDQKVSSPTVQTDRDGKNSSP